MTTPSEQEAQWLKLGHEDEILAAFTAYDRLVRWEEHNSRLDATEPIVERAYARGKIIAMVANFAAEALGVTSGEDATTPNGDAILASREVEADAPKCLECGEPVEEIIERSWWQHIDPKGRMLHNVVAPDRTCRDERCHIVNPHHHAPVEADARLAELEAESAKWRHLLERIVFEKRALESGTLHGPRSKTDKHFWTAIDYAGLQLATSARAMQSAPIAAPAEEGGRA